MGTVVQLVKTLRPTHGNTSRINAAGSRRVPAYQDLMDASAVQADIYYLTEKEIKQVRSRVYSLNRDNAFGWRWRTLVEPSRGRYNQLLIWRIH